MLHKKNNFQIKMGPEHGKSLSGIQHVAIQKPQRIQTRSKISAPCESGRVHEIRGLEL